MNPNNINSILELINGVIRIGGELLPIALRAYTALRAESGMTDEQLTAAARKLNAEGADKLAALIAKTGG